MNTNNNNATEVAKGRKKGTMVNSAKAKVNFSTIYLRNDDGKVRSEKLLKQIQQRLNDAVAMIEIYCELANKEKDKLEKALKKEDMINDIKKKIANDIIEGLKKENKDIPDALKQYADAETEDDELKDFLM